MNLNNNISYRIIISNLIESSSWPIPLTSKSHKSPRFVCGSFLIIHQVTSRTFLSLEDDRLCSSSMFLVYRHGSPAAWSCALSRLYLLETFLARYGLGPLAKSRNQRIQNSMNFPRSILAPALPAFHVESAPSGFFAELPLLRGKISCRTALDLDLPNFTQKPSLAVETVPRPKNV